LAANANKEYELVLMLDPEIPEERRDQITSEARTRIESAGSLKQDSSWGMRKLAYEIRQRTEADYRFFRFETGEALLNDLNHNLRIADGVLRFRIFKVDAGSPATVPPAPVASSAPPPRSRRPQASSSPEPEPEERSEPAEEAPEAQAEEAREPQAEEAPEPQAEESPAPAEESPVPAPQAEPAEATPAPDTDSAPAEE
jgi:small subunit ribosomal protein S6